MRRNRAFTLIELLVVIAVIGVLIGILMPVVTGARNSAKKTQCSANLRTLGQAMMAYGVDNDRKVPIYPSGGSFLWDIPRGTRDALLKYGATRNSMYCPLVDRDEDDGFWNYSDPDPAKGWTVVGYWFLNKRLPARPTPTSPPVDPSTIAADQLQSSKFEFQEMDKSKGYKKKLRESFADKHAADLELVTDSTMSTGPIDNRKFTGLSTTEYQQASHLTPEKRAEGGNILMMDGRVEWRHWKEIPRGTNPVVPNDCMQIRYRPAGRNIDQWF